VIEQVLAGVSMRSYDRSLEELPEELPCSAADRSSVSRRFVAVTSDRVEQFLRRPLGDLDFPVILLDGRGMGEHLLVVALGIDSTGKKHALGVVEGSTESEQVCRSLLGNLIERGLVVERARLFVIDGGKGLRKAVREVFGAWAVLQRCRVHKLRNVVEHLPKGMRSWVRAAMNRAWASDTVAQGRRKLKDLAGQLEKDHPGAAGSILEGLDETLTVIGLGLSGWLLKTLASTNAIENVQGTLAKVSRNVKRWRGGAMALRWGVTGLIEAERKFRRVKGHREIRQLIAALDAIVDVKPLDRQERVA
jgi:transposase-like protein